MFLLPDKFAALTYLLFGGIYPVLMQMFERLHYVISWILKFSFFNTVLSVIVAVSVYIMHIEDSEVGFTVGLYVLGNVTFLLYDIATTQLITLYLVKLRQRFRVDKYFNRQNAQKNAPDIDKSNRKE